MKTKNHFILFSLLAITCLLGCSQKEEEHYYVTVVHHPHTEESGEWGHMLGWVTTYMGEIKDGKVTWFGDKSPLYAVCEKTETGRYDWYINSDNYDFTENPPLTVFQERYLLYQKVENEWVEIPTKFTGSIGVVDPGTGIVHPLGPEKILNQSALDPGIYKLCFYIAPFMPSQEELRDEWWYLTVEFKLEWSK